jgi:hypothetical protein
MTIVNLETARGLRILCGQYLERKALGTARIKKLDQCFIVEELTNITPGTNEETWTPQTWTYEELANYKAMLLEEIQNVTLFEAEL